MEFYKKYENEFLLYDYLHKRYNIDYTACILIVNKAIYQNIDISKLIRRTDKYIKIDNSRHFILFFATDKSATFKALYSLERKLLTIYNLFDIDDIFSAFVAGKKKDRTTKDMIDLCFKMSQNNKKTGDIVTIDDCYNH